MTIAHAQILRTLSRRPLKEGGLLIWQRCPRLFESQHLFCKWMPGLPSQRR